MKTHYLLLAVICTAFFSYSCSGNKNKGAAIDESRTEIKLTEGLSTASCEIFTKDGVALISYFAENHIDAEKRKELQIDNIKYTRLNVGDSGTEDSNEYLIGLLSKASNDKIVMGSILDHIGAGKILPVYLLVENEGNPSIINEFFVSYGKDGNYVDSKVTSSIIPFVNSDVSFEVKNNIINVLYDQGGESWVQHYMVMPDMTIAKVGDDGKPLTE